MYKDEFINFNNQKALIEDYHGRKEVMDYYVGLSDTLAQENFIEKLENKLKRVSEKLARNEKIATIKNLVKKIGVLVFLNGFIWLILSFCCMPIYHLLIIPIAIVIDIAIIEECIKKFKKTKKCIKKLRIINAYLNARIMEEKQRLDDLGLEEENNQNICNTNELMIEYLPSKADEINEVNMYCNDIYHNYELYISFYKERIIDGRLRRLGYSNEEIEAIMESIEDDSYTRKL